MQITYKQNADPVEQNRLRTNSLQNENPTERNVRLIASKRVFVLMRFRSDGAIPAHLYLAPPFTMIPSNFCNALPLEQDTMMTLPGGEKKFRDTYSHLDKTQECDRRTEGRING